MATPAEFVRQVKQEVSKITWPSRADTMRGTVVVIGVSILLAVGLLGIDSVFAWVVGKIIGG